jgi:hypothetical protein
LYIAFYIGAAHLCDLLRTNREAPQHPSGQLDVGETVPEGTADFAIEPRDPVVQTEPGFLRARSIPPAR